MGFGILHWLWWLDGAPSEAVTPGPYYPVVIQGFRQGPIQTLAHTNGPVEQQTARPGQLPGKVQTGPTD